MRIEAIETIHLVYHYETPFHYGGGTCTGRLTTLVRVHTDTEHVGIGAVYSHPGMVEVVLKQHLEPLLVGMDATAVEDVWQAAYRATRWYGRKGAAMSAIGGLDTALWDLRGKAKGLPVRRLLNPDADDSVPAYASGLLWMDDVADLATEARGHLDAGYRRMKMRLGKSADYDLAALEAVRAAIGSDNDLMIDAVMGYDVPMALKMIPALARYGAFWLEEPFAPEAIEDYLRIRPAVKAAGLRMSTGENEFGVQGFDEWIRRDAVDIVQPDTCRCGGITEAWRVAQMADANGLGVAPHTWSDAVAMTANAQIVAASPRGITVEVDRTGNPFIAELLAEPLAIRDGMLRLSDAPGLGIELRQSTIDRYRIANAYELPDGNYSDFSFGAAHYQGGSEVSSPRPNSNLLQSPLAVDLCGHESRGS